VDQVYRVTYAPPGGSASAEFELVGAENYSRWQTFAREQEGTLTLVSQRDASPVLVYLTLPETDPLIAGALWSDGGVVTVSAG